MLKKIVSRYHSVRPASKRFGYPAKITWPQLVRAHEIIEIALKEISSKIVDACGIVPYNGVLTA
jgi:hypothetical protein